MRRVSLRAFGSPGFRHSRVALHNVNWTSAGKYTHRVPENERIVPAKCNDSHTLPLTQSRSKNVLMVCLEMETLSMCRHTRSRPLARSRGIVRTGKLSGGLDSYQERHVVGEHVRIKIMFKRQTIVWCFIKRRSVGDLTMCVQSTSWSRPKIVEPTRLATSPASRRCGRCQRIPPARRQGQLRPRGLAKLQAREAR